MTSRLLRLRPLARLAALCLACASPPGDDGLDRHPVLGACADAPLGQGDPFADCVDEFLPAGAGHGTDDFPAVVLGPPEAGADGNAGLDVLSLGCGGQITLYFAGPGVADGPGPDLLVFENPFSVGDGTFVEPARVLVSDDGVDWRAFACDLEDDPPTGCAGIALVRAASTNDLDPTDPEQAGGDAFDLADVGLARIRYVRLIDAGREYDPSGTWCVGMSGGFDLDALAAVH